MLMTQILHPHPAAKSRYNPVNGRLSMWSSRLLNNVVRKRRRVIACIFFPEGGQILWGEISDVMCSLLACGESILLACLSVLVA
uniref:Uncharacterized protein n=1 Tax=Marseillevirus LCMAC201 TaxID=2506605 RepID=A0A481YVU5_9VIRU|nr:MAG: hypothetical protein LCMAC201_01210 [Marseillevirus LCMAC201]